ncbi:MAG: endonuclease/exonuclease/phosphatase family protein [Phycisphaerae bacterium]|nr:endonuclease/exonuclease/phosphatase family protein [Phycisphaerae bacterium]
MTTFRLTPIALITAFLAGCHPPSRTSTEPTHAEFVTVVVDGDIGEWPGDSSAYADEHYLYLRFSVQGEQDTIQASSRGITLLVDADGSTSTGYVSPFAPMNELGVDLQLEFSPLSPRGGRARGVRLSAVDGAGNTRPLSKEDFDIVFAPTYASSWYEVRINRTPENAGGLPETGLLGPGRITTLATYTDDTGAIVAFSDPMTVTTDIVCPGGRRTAAFAPPEKPTNAVRVLSWNVLRSAPMDNPGAFARILTALAPDVILLQEWEKGDAAAVQDWFDRNIPIGHSWSVRKAPGDLTNGGGVAVVSRFPMTAVLGESLFSQYKDDRGADRRSAIRSVAGSIETPHGQMLALSTHLKSGGGKDGIEDRRRIAEARAINTTFAAVAAATGAPFRVIGGDMNLVGSRPPIDVLRAGLDTDNSDLTPAPALVHGDHAYYTWRDAGTAFAPGRLDWIVYSDASAKAVNAFVFDESRLTDEVRASMGLQRGDGAASDHMPTVVDLVRIR